MNYNILDYGAKSNGDICTAAIQTAIDNCFLNGGGEVIVPSGTYLTGGLRLRSGITLHLLENAVLLGSTAPEEYAGFINDSVEPISEAARNAPVSTAKSGVSHGASAYPYSKWNNAIIRAINAENIAIIGEKGSEINGQNCFDPTGEEGYRGPHAMNMWFCKNVTLCGYTIRDSANWAHAIQNSRDIRAENITVLGGHDGFDIRTCDEVYIENSVFKTGDDCIAGFDNIGVNIKNCYFESACSIFRFGGTDVVIEDCRSAAIKEYAYRGSLSNSEKINRLPTNNTHRQNCLNVFLYYCDNRAEIRKTPGNIIIRNSYFKSADAIMGLPFGHIWCCNRSLSDILFENCTFEEICAPMQLNCPENEPLSLNMKNCSVSARKGFEEIDFINGKNIKKIELDNLRLKNFTSPEIVCEPQPEITISDFINH